MDTTHSKPGIDSSLTRDYANIRSEAMTEIIDGQPGFLDKWSLLVFLSICIALLAAAWFIYYPEKITAKGRVVATNGPRQLIVTTGGYLSRLLSKPDDVVSKGQIIGYLESTGKHDQLLLLGKMLDSTISEIRVDSTKLSGRFGWYLDSLGELQQAYQSFVTDYLHYKDYVENGFFFQKKKMLNEDLMILQHANDNLLAQKSILESDSKLTEESYKVAEILLKQNVISKQDDRNEKSKLLNKELGVSQINSNILNQKITRQAKIKELAELEHEVRQQRLIFLQSLQTLSIQLADWKLKHLITAPVSGRLVFLKHLEEAQFLTPGSVLGFVQPPSGRYYIEAHIPQVNSFKVYNGQPAQIYFDAYPRQEYGYVEGNISYINDFATDSGFLVNITLPDKLFTTQKKSIVYRGGLTMQANIIVKDTRLLEYIYYSITRPLAQLGK